MRYITLDEVIKRECKNKKFAAHFQRELLINEVAKMVVNLRQKLRLTQRELAIKVGTTQPVIARLESGADKRVPSLKLLNKLAYAANGSLKIVISYPKD